MTTPLTLVPGPGAEGDRVLTVTGEIDMSNAAGFGSALDRELGTGAAVTVDLSGVGYLDSAGVAVLFDRADAHELHLVAPPLLARVLQISGLDKVTTATIR